MSFGLIWARATIEKKRKKRKRRKKKKEKKEEKEEKRNKVCFCIGIMCILEF